MQYDSHRDPKTGAYDGIEIRQVPAGSMAANHGAQAGDIIKSINGHPVKSVQEAINFAKNNANLYDVWEIEVENKGQIRIVTYKVPKKK
jgi:S1-C subfamily serine protease